MSLLSHLEPPSPVHVLPELREAMLAEIKNRLSTDIEPSLWKAHFDNENSGGLGLLREPTEDEQKFLEDSFRIVDSVIGEFIETNRLAKLTTKQRQYLHESLFEESQAFWYEHIKDLQPAFSFIEHILGIAQREIEELFPDCQRVFGPMAKSLLVDLDFQHEFYLYARVAKPDLVDLRRMINISGQIVEAIFFCKFFPKEELNLRQIREKLKGFRDATNKNRTTFFGSFPKGRLLQSDNFLGSLSTVKDLRDTYSHGGSSKQVSDDDFENCIRALIDNKIGVLPKLYEVLRDLK